MTCISVVVDTFVADGETPDGNGICYTVQALDGWWGTPGLTFSTLEVAPFGEVVQVAHENGRALSLTLVAHVAGGRSALGQTLCQTAINTVKAAFAALYSNITLEVIDPVSDQEVDVRLVAAIQTAILGESVAVKFLIQLLATDPTLLTV